MSRLHVILASFAWLAFGLAALGCGGNETATTQASAAHPVPDAPPQSAPPASSTGGFDGQRAYQYVADIVAIGPHSAGTDGSHRAQAYIVSKLKSFGCPVDQEDFHTPSPIGTVAMENIVAKIPGASPDIVLLTTHYDSKHLPGFVGANDGGSSTGVALEMARLLCARKNALTFWIAFFDGEEAFNPTDWVDPDNTYGSRELAARMSVSGDLGRMKAMLLVDMIGGRDLTIKREKNSTPWLTDMVWSTAARLGYKNTFVSAELSVEDDHLPFLARKAAAVDIIDLETPQSEGFWHTNADTLDKVNPVSLAIVGHVLIEVIPQLEQKFRTGKPS
jgi:glutaminyl-peptide cyclotransferase